MTESPYLINRIRGEFIEMPGMRLTLAQAARLCGVDQAACRRIVNLLVGSGFLRWTPSGTIARAD